MRRGGDFLLATIEAMQRLGDDRRRLALAARTERIVGEIVEAAAGKAATPSSTERSRTLGG